MLRAPPLIAAALACAAGCGRLGFDAVEPPQDSAVGDAQLVTSGSFTRTPLPSGCAIEHLALTPDRAVRYAAVDEGPVFRSTDGETWTPCAYIETLDVSVGSGGTVYVGAIDDVYRSTDQCATWEPLHLGDGAYTVREASDGLYALGYGIMRRYDGSAWTTQTTPIDSNTQFHAFATDASGTELLAGTAGGGIIRRVGSGAWQQTTGWTTGQIADLAISPTDTNVAYAIENSGAAGPGDVLVSTNGGVSWTAWVQNGGFAVAIDPADPQHAVASLFNDIVVTTDGGATHSGGQRFATAPAATFALAFGSDGGVLAATQDGLYAASSELPLGWTPHSQGLDAWSIASVTPTASGIYLAAQGGVLHATGSAAFTVTESGLTITSTVADVLVVDEGHAISSGRVLSLSTDGGLSWPTVDDTEVADGFVVNGLVTDGTRVWAGTGTRVLYADPPYLAWTPSALLGTGHFATQLVLNSAGLWAATLDGLTVSTDRGATFQTVSIPNGLASLATFADGTLIGGMFDQGVWLSDATGHNWKMVAFAGQGVRAMLVSGETAIAGTNAGVFVSRDRGATWTDVPGLDDREILSLAVDPVSGDLLVGTAGSGLWRAPFP